MLTMTFRHTTPLAKYFRIVVKEIGLGREVCFLESVPNYGTGRIAA